MPALDPWAVFVTGAFVMALIACFAYGFSTPHK